MEKLLEKMLDKLLAKFREELVKDLVKAFTIREMLARNCPVCESQRYYDHKWQAVTCKTCGDKDFPY